MLSILSKCLLNYRNISVYCDIFDKKQLLILLIKSTVFKLSTYKLIIVHKYVYNHFLSLKINSTISVKSTINPTENKYPYFQCSSGIKSKFIPYILAINVGGRNITLTTVNILMILFCSILTRPKKVSCR